MSNKLHSPEEQLKTIKLFWDLFEILAHTSQHEAGPSYDELCQPYQSYLSEQGLPQMSADELWHELHSKMYP